MFSVTDGWLSVVRQYYVKAINDVFDSDQLKINNFEKMDNPKSNDVVIDLTICLGYKPSSLLKNSQPISRVQISTFNSGIRLTKNVINYISTFFQVDSLN